MAPFRREPAIAGLAWPFTPTPRSPEGLDHHRLRASTGLTPASPCPGVDRPASGLTPLTTGPFGPCPSPRRAAGTRFPYGSGADPLSLARRVNSLARDSRRTTRRRYPPSYSPYGFPSGGLPFPAASKCSRPVSGSFHSPSGVLFTFPSRYSCAIGVGTYLALEVGAPQLPAGKPTHGTQGSRDSSSGVTPTGLSPSTAWDFHPSSASPFGGTRALQPHISPMLPWGIRFGLPPFRSPLLRGSQLVSFPAGTKMFQFPAFPLLTEQFGDPGIDGCVRLPRAYGSLPPPSSAPDPRHPPAGVGASPDPFDLPCAAS